MKLAPNFLKAKYDITFEDNDVFRIKAKDLRELVTDFIDSLGDASPEAISAVFLAGGGILLSPAARALQAAGKLFWLYDDGGAPAAGQRTIIQLAARGVKNDGQLGSNNKLTAPSLDNTAALFAVRDEVGTLPFRQQKPVTLIMPAGGVVTYADSRWADGINDLVVDLNGTTILTSYTGNDNKRGRAAFNGVLLQRRVATYGGLMEYIDPVLIQDARAGDTTITAVQAGAFSDSTIWFVGAYVLPWAKEVVFRGEPVGARNFEDGTAKIVGISPDGRQLTLSKPLAFDYLTSYPDYTGTPGSPSGSGRITSLDNPAHRIPDRITFENGTIVAAENCPEAFAMVARELVRLHNVKVIGNLTPTETPGAVELDKVDLDGEFEVDKLVGRKGKVRIINGSRLRKAVTNGGGSGGVDIEDSQSDTTVQLCAPTMKVVRSKLAAKAFELFDVTTNTTITKDSDAALADYPGAQPGEWWIGQNEFSASNHTAAYINIATYQRHEVKEVDAQGRLVTRWDGSDDQNQFPFWKMATAGTALLTEDGKQGGRMIETVYEKYPGNAPGGIFRTRHTGPPFVVGQVVIWTPVLTVRDDGQHTIATPTHPARLFSEESLIWKGNQLPASATSRTVTITKSDLAYNQFGAAYFQFRAKPTSVTFSTPGTAPGGKVKVTALDKGRGVVTDLCCFSLSQATTRTCSATASAGGMTAVTAGEPDQNQYRPDNFGKFTYTFNVFVGGVTVAEAPEFSLTFTFDTY